ncbi:helix-turn-helix domain-containing protein [Gardnerella sp. KA00390]|uniref:helix-turn-helix domain-containing protein n=1 Tax=Gardnerella TaxID=2701 RepID=UPI000B33FCEA
MFCLYAEDAGISSASIARISKGENVNTETLLRICQYLECDIKDICEVKQVKNNEVK